MIQELLGGNSGLIIVGGEKKMVSMNNGTASNGGILEAATPSTLLISPSTSASASASSVAENNSNNNNQLRCPRCDSANTKFCYYNNYNLTQPRHFCKTCRRYWTKGGALRNVPIGGGCRKNKTATILSSSAAKSSNSAAAKLNKSGGIEHFVDVHTTSPSSPVLWGSPQSSHLLALLRSVHQNPSPKEEGESNLGRSLGLDPSLGLCSSFWRSSNSQQTHHSLPFGNQNGFTLNDHQQQVNNNNNNQQSNGIQELYQRLRSSSPGNGFYNNNDQTAVVLTHHHVGSSSSISSSLLEAATVNNGGGELGFWNNSSPFSWSDHLQPTTTTINGVYP